MRMKKRLALLLAAVMLVGLLPTAALAEGGEQPAPPENQGGGQNPPALAVGFSVQNSDKSFGSVVYKIGDDTEWKAVELTEQTGEMPEGGTWKKYVGTLPGPLAVNTSVTFKAVLETGYSLDTHRGVYLWVDGQSTKQDSSVETALTSENGYTFTPTENKQYEFEFGFMTEGGGDHPGGDPGDDPGHDPQDRPKDTTWKLTDANGVTAQIAITEGHNSFAVPENFDLTKPFKVTVLKCDGTDYPDGEFESGKWKDSEGRDPFEIMTSDKTVGRLILGVWFHGHSVGQTTYGEFYYPGIMLYKPSYRGVRVSTEKQPDMYDFTGSGAVALESTSASNPGKIAVYYGDTTIQVASGDPEAYRVTAVALGDGVPATAVTITEPTGPDAAWQVEVQSAFYDRVPLVITVKDSEDRTTTGYVTVERIGIYISTGRSRVENGDGEGPLHGAAHTGAPFPAKYQPKDVRNLVASFYYDKAHSFEDYSMVATLTYRDGSTEVRTVEGYGEVNGEHGAPESRLKAGDYILWSSADENPKGAEAPVSVSVIAVKAAAGSSSDSFAGAMLGSGAGVTGEVRFGPAPNEEG